MNGNYRRKRFYALLGRRGPLSNLADYWYERGRQAENGLRELAEEGIAVAQAQLSAENRHAGPDGQAQ